MGRRLSLLHSGCESVHLVLPGRLQLFDITLPLSEHTVVFPGDPLPLIQRVSDLQQGDALTTSTFAMGCHVGTHVDAPAHFLSTGKLLEELPLECFYGPAQVLCQQGNPVVEQAQLERISIPLGHHILLKTDNGSLLSKKTFSEEYCTLSVAAAEYLCKLNPLSIGWDYYSLDPVGHPESFPAHTVLAEAGIPVFVCLHLVNVPPGQYWFAGFPLRLEGVEGAPVRAVLSRQEA